MISGSCQSAWCASAGGTWSKWVNQILAMMMMMMMMMAHVVVVSVRHGYSSVVVVAVDDDDAIWPLRYPVRHCHHREGRDDPFDVARSIPCGS